ncbi:MAG: pentapeptide repeat-containing protein [Leptolyngbyaceae cyanobacterium]
MSSFYTATMVGIDYVQLIEQGVDAWNRWRAEHPDECPNLESAYLFEKSLQGINFSRTNLSRACLIGADLTEADLSKADLSGVYANNANFHGASLTGADLQDGNFIEANLAWANLLDTVTDNANFTDACLQDTCLAGWPDVQPVPTVARAPQAQPAAAPVGAKRLPWLLLSGMAGGAIALAAGYGVLQSRAPKFVTPDGTVTIQLVCNEPDVMPVVQDPDHVYPNGTEFYGAFEDGQPASGRGTMVYANGNRYDGNYRNGQRNGCGTFAFANGRRYVGEFKDDLFSGRGMWEFANGDRYIGDFEFNRCNGEGVFLFADGTSVSGIWQQGRLVDDELTCDRAP